jgi:hypothetical protein
MTNRLPSPPVYAMKSAICRQHWSGVPQNHQQGIDAHVDDAAVLGEAALRREAMQRGGGIFD